MDVPSLQNLAVLKQAIGSESQLYMNHVEHCAILKCLIDDKIDRHISLVVIQRLFDFKPSKFPPSRYTLDILVLYCGYNDWIAFINNSCS